MATITLRRLTDLVGIRLGEFPDCRLPPESTSIATSLSDMIIAVLQTTAERITRETPLSAFSETTDFSKHLLRETDWGETHFAETPLPADFCRLHSLRLHSWTQTLSEEYPGDPLRASLAENAPTWMLASPGRPWLRIIRHDSQATLRFGPPEAISPIMACYIPLPEYDKDDEWLTNFDASLTPALVDSIVAQLRETEQF